MEKKQAKEAERNEGFPFKEFLVFIPRSAALWKNSPFLLHTAKLLMEI